MSRLLSITRKFLCTTWRNDLFTAFYLMILATRWTRLHCQRGKKIYQYLHEYVPSYLRKQALSIILCNCNNCSTFICKPPTPHFWHICICRHMLPFSQFRHFSFYPINPLWIVELRVSRIVDDKGDLPGSVLVYISIHPATPASLLIGCSPNLSPSPHFICAVFFGSLIKLCFQTIRFIWRL